MESRTTRDAQPDPDPEPFDEVFSGAWTGGVLLLITGGLFVAALFVFPATRLLSDLDGNRTPLPTMGPATVFRIGLFMLLALGSAYWLAQRRRDDRRRGALLDAREHALPSATQGLAIHVAPRPGTDCPFCHDELAPGDLGEGVVRCPACEVSHHTACWREHAGCSTLGCRRDPNQRDERRAVTER